MAEPVARKYKLLHPKMIGGIFLYLVKIKNYEFDYVKKFFELFANPYECDVDSINALRDKLIREMSGNTRLQKSIKIKYVMKAWNGYVLKKKMALLKLTPSELESIWFI